MSPALTLEAEPALEPLAPSSVFHGLRVWPPNQVSPQARAPSVVLAMSTAPASVSRRTATASRVATRSLNGVAPQVVRIPSVSSKSLAPQGTPWSGPR